MNVMHNSEPAKKTNKKLDFNLSATIWYNVFQEWESMKNMEKGKNKDGCKWGEKPYSHGATFNQAYQVISSNSASQWWSLSAGNLPHLH